MIRTVVNEFKWKPADISGLFLDSIDYEGVIYWFEFIKSKYPKDNK